MESKSPKDGPKKNQSGKSKCNGWGRVKNGKQKKATPSSPSAAEDQQEQEKKRTEVAAGKQEWHVQKEAQLRPGNSRVDPKRFASAAGNDQRSVRGHGQHGRSRDCRAAGNLQPNRSIQSGQRHESRNNKGHDEFYLSFKNLKDLSSINSDEAMVKVLSNQAAFEKFMSKEMRADFFVLTLKVLNNICRANFTGIMTNVINQACSSVFLQNLENYLKKLPFENAAEQSQNKIYYENINGFWFNLVEFFQKIIELVPRAACDKLTPVLKKIQVIIPSIELGQKYKVDDKVKNDILSMINDLETEIKKFSTNNTAIVKEEEQNDKSKPPESFRELSVFPTTEELYKDDVYLRACKIKDSYDSVEHYLDVQFRLLKEDFVKPLRNGIKEYLSGTQKYRNNDFRIYKNTSLQLFDINEFNAGIGLYFGKLNFIDWNRSKRLIFGALLLLSKDNFNTIIFATVSNRDKENLVKGYITIEPCFGTVITPDMYNCNLVLLESKIYFEPYFAILSAMKNINENNFPMEKYFVKAEVLTKIPKYLESVNNLKFKNKFVLPINNSDNWPNAEALKLDDSQYTAFKKALTEELAVIQGPPGTGKTFLALQIVEALLENKTKWLKHGPIVVVCLTNHALDQFLKGILQYTKSIVRVGTRSKSQTLKPFALTEIRRGFNRYNTASSLLFKIKNQIEKIFQLVSKLRLFIKYLSTPGIIIPLEAFQNCQYKVPLKNFKNTEDLVYWLLDIEVTPLINPTKVTDETKLTEKKNEEIESNEPTKNYIFDDYENIHTDVDVIYDYEKLKAIDCYGPIYPLQIFDNQIKTIQDHIKYLRNDISAVNLPFSPIPQWEDYLFKIHQNRENLRQELNKHPIINQCNEPTDNPRWQQYWSWIRTSYDYISNKILNFEREYRRLNMQLCEMRHLADLEVMRKHEVIGLTTTCAAKIQSSLRSLKAPIVLVEEAAEILESHVVCSMTKDCQHVILIGDHKQLRPKASVYELGTKYNLNVSLFERMVNIRGECTQLAHQHRMRPLIAKLITPSIYETLHNHNSVLNYPAVKGLDKSLFFINHKEHEENYQNDDSWMNKHEVKFLVAFARHLLMQGYCPDDITILCMYTGQLFAFMNELHQHALLAKVRVTTVDNFQGEENKIILLSLVRNNGEGNVGFLKEENRVCVALSRAREGLYIMGNMQDLLMKNSIWPKINKVLEDENAIGDSLKLRCQIHRDQFFEIKNANDFKQCPEGGCTNKCDLLLPCGHLCTNICHILDREHKNYKCKQNCNGICSNNHSCKLKCWEGCKPCLVNMEQTLKCGHTIPIPCSADVNTFFCSVEVETTLPDCNHVVKKPCSHPVEKFSCTYNCDIRLDCGHSCLKRCHVRFDPEHKKYNCNKNCTRKNVNCSKNHICKKRCFEECEPCSVLAKKSRSCGHFYPKIPCSLDVETIICQRKCKRIMNCGHKCLLKCADDCNNCQEIVTKKSPCGHEMEVKCCEEATTSKCKKNCQKILPCNHPCTNQCKEKCTTTCKAMVSLLEPGLCGHIFSVPCYLKNSDPKSVTLLKYCKELCNTPLACKHTCKGNCGVCFQGRMHVACSEPCRAVFICGHTCKIACNQECQPCTEKCFLRCCHTRCNKKCGVPCIPCREPCSRRCIHQSCEKLCHEMCDIEPCDKPCNRKLACKHPCVGFCGEPCPPICRTCDKDKITTIFLGYEDQPNARFVLLPDCQHSIEHKGLMQWIKPAETNQSKEIKTPTCPLCKTPIKSCNRIMNIIKEELHNVMVVKKKIFSNGIDLGRTQQKYVESLKKMEKDQIMNSFDDLKKYVEKLIKYESSVNKNKKQHFSYNEINAFKIILDILEEIHIILNKIKRINISCGMVNNQVKMLMKWLPGKLEISKQRLDDIQFEMRRLHLMVYVYNLFSTELEWITSKSQKEYDFLKEQLLVPKKFIQNIEANIINNCKIVNDHKNAVIEQKIIIKAVTGVKKGSWFKCPNGHFYAIGDCGGAVVQSVCIECKAPVGGKNHQLDPTNFFAPEIDGSAQPAWPNVLHR